MEFHQLHYFVAVAETGGFSRAAERCNVAQPSLSQQIIKLEQELDEKLFERLGRTVRLTPAGKALLPRAQRILAELQSIKSSINDEIASGRGKVSVGIIPTLAPFLLPQSLELFHNSYPLAELEVVEHTTELLLEALLNFELDVCYASLPISHSLIQTEKLFHEPLLVAMPHDHELESCAELSVSQLRTEPFIALHEDHCLSQQVDNFCYEQQINPKIVCRTSHLWTVQSCVAAGLGIALVPNMLAETDLAETCIYRPLLDATPQRTIVALYHAQRSRSLLAKEFTACFQQAYNQLRGLPGIPSVCKRDGSCIEQGMCTPNCTRRKVQGLQKAIHAS